jgi:zinc protease
MNAITRPSPGTARPYHFPEVERQRLPNGIRVLVARMPRLPLVTVLALVDAGASCDPAGAEGTSALTARTLTEGTASLGGAALTDRLEALGTSLDGYADWDSTAARFTVMPSRLDEAFALFADVLRAPAFPARDVERRRDERLADLTQRLSEPRGLADQRFTGFLYSPSSRYAQPAGGTLRSVATLGAASVRDFHARHYAPPATTLIFVGDVTMQEALRLSEAAFGDWRAPVAIGSGAPASERSLARRTVIVDKPDAPQTELRIGHVGVPRSHPDHLRIVVMNALLGGLFSSRINLNLRERHAFTYGASSGFDWRRDAGPFVVSTAVKSEVTDRAVQEILNEIDGMRMTAPDANELALATDYLAGVFPLRYESTDAVAGAIANTVIFGLPDDWFLTYRQRIRAITTDEILGAARAHLDPSRLLVLALGDPAVIRSPLEALPIGAVRVVAPSHEPSEGD